MSTKPLKGSANYIWWEKDELGKGATATVYKCREKVGRFSEVHFLFQHALDVLKNMGSLTFNLKKVFVKTLKSTFIFI